MELGSGIAGGHRCAIKNKLAELAEEVNSWEDDVRHSSQASSRRTSSDQRSPLKNTCRESLAVLDLVPVSAHKARWERLMSSKTNAIKPVTHPSQETKTISNVTQKTGTRTAIHPHPPRVDVARSSVSHAERERLERMAELAALRRARRGVVLRCPLTSTVEETSSQAVSSSKLGSTTDTKPEVGDFALPPPPSPSEVSQNVDAVSTDTVPSTLHISSNTDDIETPTAEHQLPPETSDAVTPSIPSHGLTVQSSSLMGCLCNPVHQFTSLAPPEPCSTPQQPLTSRSSCVSDSFTNISSFVEDPVTEGYAPSHAYYSRPKFGAKRTHANCADELATPQTQTATLPRQRSVTFAAPHGTAPGDTASEATTLECDAESILRGNNASARGRGAKVRLTDSDETDLHSSPDESPLDTDDDDSELSELLDNALEEAAAEEVSKDKENRSRLGFPTSDAETTDDALDDGACSEPEGVSNKTAIAQELHENIGLVRKSSFLTESHASPRLSRGNSLRRSTSQRNRRRRQSGSVAGALLDVECPTPTTRSRRSEKHDTNDFPNTTNADSEAQRRLDRLTELPALLQVERNVILQASTALQQCVIQGGSATVVPTPKRSRHGSVALTNTGSACGIGSAAHVEASRMLLIACQRRQVLMEELALLHRGSSVLVPPSRGDPIRARLRMTSVRLGLKSFHKPGDPTSGGGGYVVFRNDYLVHGSHSKSPTRLSELRTSPTQYHLLAIIKCRGEGRLYHSEMITLVPVNDMPVGTARAVTHVDLPANIDIVPLRPDFVFTLEVYCMRVGFDGPSTLQLSQSPKVVLNSMTQLDTHAQVGATPKSSRLHLTSNSARKKARFQVTGSSEVHSGLAACLPSTHLMPSPLGSTSTELVDPSRGKTAAFTLLSSVEIRYHDDLLLGRLRPTGEEARRTSKLDTTDSTDLAQLPLRLSRLPRSSPLNGLVGLINASVRLEARILTRGFLTVFEEVGGYGVWQRYWCQLRADHLQFWRYPEDEQRALHADPSQSVTAPPPSPLGRIDLRHVAAPRAVPAPRRICARANTIFMRSLRAIDPDILSASVNAPGSKRSERVDQQESLIFRASPDYTWLEQKHLLCADTPQERDRWMMWLNLCSEALKDWMPEHFSCLARFDARLEFSQPVSSQLAALLVHGDPNE